MTPEKHNRLINQKILHIHLINMSIFRMIEFNNLLAEGRRSEISYGAWNNCIRQIGRSYCKINQINQKLGVTRFKRPVFEWWNVKL